MRIEGRERVRVQCRKTLGSSCRRVTATEVCLTLAALRRGTDVERLGRNLGEQLRA